MDPSHTLSALRRFYAEITLRKVRKRLMIYLSAALTILGVINLFSGVYGLPPALFDGALAVLLCGIPCAIATAWIHGPEGRQRVPWQEMVVYGACVLLAAFFVHHIVTFPRLRVAAEAEKSIAVLPFVNLSDNKDDEYFSDGVTEDIITQLSRIADLRVISRTSIMQYKGTRKATGEIAQELNVTHILEGSIRRSADRVRIVGQLIDARSDEHLWAETYDREVHDVFAIQSDVARSIAHALQAKLTSAELERIDRKSTQNVDAYAYYLRGREYYYNYTEKDNDQAIGLFRKALSLDSHYALAYAGLGDAYALRTSRYHGGMGWTDSAMAMASNALSIDPDLAEGHKAMGFALENWGKIQDALSCYYKAVERNPNYAPVVASIGATNFTLGRFDEALRWEKKAVALRPGFAHYYALVGLQYYSLGFDSASVAWFTQALALQPGMVFPEMVLTYVDLYAGDPGRARKRIHALLTTHPDEGPAIEIAGDVELLAGHYGDARRYYLKACTSMGEESPVGVKLAHVLLRLGKHAEAEAIVKRMIAAYDVEGTDYPEGSLIPYALADAYALMENGTRTALWLQRAVDIGYRDHRWVSADPLLGNMRARPDVGRALKQLEDEYLAMRQRVLAAESGN
jgi:TolB-like protein/Tfp pilus assembly protein PilF